MSALCYWCEDGASEVVQDTVGKKGHPIGTCKKCHVLSCGHHGVRDAVHKEYRCFSCDKSIILASAAQLTSSNGGNQARVIGNDRYAAELLAERAGLLFKSLEELKARRPEYKTFIERILRVLAFLQNMHSTSGELRFFNTLPDDAKFMAVLSALLWWLAYGRERDSDAASELEKFLLMILSDVP